MTVGAELARRGGRLPGCCACPLEQAGNPPPAKKIHPIPSVAVNIKRTRRGEIAANGRLNQAWGLETVKFNILLTFPLICAVTPPLVEARFAFFLFFGLAWNLGITACNLQRACTCAGACSASSVRCGKRIDMGMLNKLYIIGIYNWCLARRSDDDFFFCVCVVTWISASLDIPQQGHTSPFPFCIMCFPIPPAATSPSQPSVDIFIRRRNFKLLSDIVIRGD